MMIEIIFLWITVILAIATIYQRKAVHAVLLRAGVSIMAAGSYLVLLAPDVAIAEAMIGSLLGTFVYILLLKNPGTLVVGYVPVRMLFDNRGYGFEGIQYEIIERFAKEQGFKLRIERFQDMKDLLYALGHEMIDVACGPIVGKGERILKTKLYKFKGKMYDYLSLQDLFNMRGYSLKDAKDIEYITDTQYIIEAAPHIKNEIENFIRNLKHSGEFKSILSKYLGGKEEEQS